MYDAPAVSYPVGRSRFQGWLLAAVMAVSAGSLSVWFMQSDQAGWRQLAALGLGLVTSSVALLSWFRSPAGLLTWDTKIWLWCSGDEARQVKVSAVLDGQSTLLLHLRLPGDRSLWIWPQRHTVPARWLALRRAVFARQSTALIPDADGFTP